MSRDWTPDELQAASRWMQEQGHLSYEEFCAALARGEFRITPTPGPSVQLKPEDQTEGK